MSEKNNDKERRKSEAKGEMASMDFQLEALKAKQAPKQAPKQAVTDEGEVGPEFLADS